MFWDDEDNFKIAFWGIVFISLIVFLFIGSHNGWFKNEWIQNEDDSVSIQWKEQNTALVKSGKTCEIMYLKSNGMKSTKRGVAIDAYSRGSLSSSLVIPYEKSHLMKNLAEDSFIEVCYKDGEFDTLKPYHGIKE